MRISDKLYPLFIPFSLLLAYSIYSPGFTAGFIFDDTVNLSRFIDMREGSAGLWEFLRYKTDRPLAFLAFMLDDNIWPSTPDSFILTNFLLHLFCGCLLTTCLILIGKNLGWSQQKRELIAIYTTLVWLVHPLFVSTVLYVVQRMTILSAIFVLLSLISYLYGRLLITKHNYKCWFWLVIATPGFAFLGLLCKENAALLPIYLLVFELVLFLNQKLDNKYYLVWKVCYIYIPVVVMGVCVLIFLHSWYDTYYLRDFSLIERLLTQARIVTYYLFLLMIPKSSTNGLHYDNYPISYNLLDPLTTLPSIIFIFGLILISILYRKKYLILSFSILFFFAGHIMESSFIALELYFEHRNYLPSMMLFFLISYYLFQNHKKYKKAVTLAAFIIILTLSSVTYARASLWGKQLLLLSVWSENNPGTSRNYIEGHIRAHNLKRYDLAYKFILKGIERLPNNVHLWIGYTGYSCGIGKAKRSDVDKLKELMEKTEQTRKDHLYYNLTRFIDAAKAPSCDLITNEDVKEVLLAALKNPNILKFNIRVHEMMHLLGRVELESKNYLKAKESFLKSFQLNAHPNVALQQTALIATHEQYALAHEYLIETRELIYGSYDKEQREKVFGWNDFLYMESVLLEELKN